jgi:hypothetical protein
MKLLKTTLLVFIIVATAQSGSAQKQLLKLEDIWANRQFFAAGLPEIRSMNNGLHFTELINDEQGYYIVVNEFSSGKSID